MIIYLIEHLWVDPLENTISHAIGYDLIGFVSDPKEAEQIMKNAGDYKGTGWPINKGKKIPRIRIEPVKHYFNKVEEK